MPRHFDRTANDYILFSPGNLANATGAITVALIWYTTATNADQGLIRAEDSSNTPAWYVNPFSDGVAYFTEGGFAATQTYTANEWRLDAWSRPAGATQTVRGHAFTYTAGTWAHTDYGTSSNSGVSPVDHIYLGRIDASNDLVGEIAVAGVWKRVLSDGELQTLSYSLSAWKSLAPDALWALNQASTADAVTDLSGGGANQSAISGTSVSSLEVPGFSYADDQRILAYRYAMLRDPRLVYG